MWRYNTNHQGLQLTIAAHTIMMHAKRRRDGGQPIVVTCCSEVVKPGLEDCLEVCPVVLSAKGDKVVALSHGRFVLLNSFLNKYIQLVLEQSIPEYFCACSLYDIHILRFL